MAVEATGLRGKVALVTGAGGGIGAEIAAELAEAGAAIAALDRDGAAAAATAESLTADGAQAIALTVDITDSKAVNAAFEEARSALGPIDVLVNCAGFDKIEPFLDNTEDDWDRIIAINLKGPIIVTRAALDQMIEHGGGRIVNIASDAGRVGSSGEAVYSAAKGGIIAFTKTLAREMVRHQINVNCVCPGPTDTPLLGTMDDRLRGALEKAIPMRRIAQPHDIAPVVVFLASDGARYMTGQTVSVSGGLTMA
jgi:2-hydroxycyclohexanecarboxyl-CoA dehydrogenase